VLYPVAKPTAKVLDWWLGPEGVHHLREKMLRQYIEKSMGASDSDIGTFEGKGAVNFLVLDGLHVSEEGAIVDPRSIISLPFVDGRLEMPGHADSVEGDFVRHVQASGKKWVILTDPKGIPRAILNADRFLRILLSVRNADPHDYCVVPIVTSDPRATLEQTLMSAKLTDWDSPEKGIILFWGTEKRIIDHADLLWHLFDGVFSPPLKPVRKALIH
jgi:hypothetical protein